MSCLLIVCSLYGHSQCSYQMDNVDKFTKSHTLVTSWQRVNYPAQNAQKAMMALGRITADSTDLYVVLVELDYLENMVCINDRSKLYILQTNGETVELTAVKFNCSENGTAIFQYWIDKEDLVGLKNVEAIRVQHTDGSIDVDFTGKITEKQVGINFFSTNVPCVVR